MSIGGHTSTNSSTTVGLATSSLALTSKSASLDSDARGNNGGGESHEEAYKPDSKDSASLCCKSLNKESLVDKKALDDAALQSLRWEGQCSDEEKEKERIEIYKENRRKRYENALEEKRAQLSLHTTNRTKYYI